MKKKVKKSQVLGRPRAEREFLRKGWASPSQWKAIGKSAKEWQSIARTYQEELAESVAWRAAVIATMHRFLRTAADDAPGQVSARASFVGFIGASAEDLQVADFVGSLNLDEDGKPQTFAKLRKEIRGGRTQPKEIVEDGVEAVRVPGYPGHVDNDD